MRRSRLQLRSPPWIALGYLAGPVAGLTVWLAATATLSQTQLRAIPGIWVITLMFGVPVCLLVEVVAVTPILMAFHRFRWWWLNAWSAAAIGFALAVGFWGLVGVAWPTDDADPVPDVWRVTDGWTLPGWMEVAASHAVVIAWFGVVGLVAALVFRLVAVRVSDVNPSAPPADRPDRPG